MTLSAHQTHTSEKRQALNEQTLGRHALERKKTQYTLDKASAKKRLETAQHVRAGSDAIWDLWSFY